MEPSYPEMALFTDMIDLRSRIEELAPLTPSATPRQKGYRDFLQALLKTLPDSIPGQDDHSDSSRDPDDAGGAGQVAQNDDLNLLVRICPVWLNTPSHRVTGSKEEDDRRTQGRKREQSRRQNRRILLHAAYFS